MPPPPAPAAAAAPPPRRWPRPRAAPAAAAAPPPPRPRAAPPPRGAASAQPPLPSHLHQTRSASASARRSSRCCRWRQSRCAPGAAPPPARYRRLPRRSRRASASASAAAYMPRPPPSPPPGQPAGLLGVALRLLLRGAPLLLARWRLRLRLRRRVGIGCKPRACLQSAERVHVRAAAARGAPFGVLRAKMRSSTAIARADGFASARHSASGAVSGSSASSCSYKPARLGMCEADSSSPPPRASSAHSGPAHRRLRRGSLQSSAARGAALFLSGDSVSEGGPQRLLELAAADSRRSARLDFDGKRAERLARRAATARERQPRVAQAPIALTSSRP